MGCLGTILVIVGIIIALGADAITGLICIGVGAVCISAGKN